MPYGSRFVYTRFLRTLTPHTLQLPFYTLPLVLPHTTVYLPVGFPFTRIAPLPAYAYLRLIHTHYWLMPVRIGFCGSAVLVATVLVTTLPLVVRLFTIPILHAVARFALPLPVTSYTAVLPVRSSRTHALPRNTTVYLPVHTTFAVLTFAFYRIACYTTVLAVPHTPALRCSCTVRLRFCHHRYAVMPFGSRCGYAPGYLAVHPLPVLRYAGCIFVAVVHHRAWLPARLPVGYVGYPHTCVYPHRLRLVAHLHYCRSTALVMPRFCLTHRILVTLSVHTVLLRFTFTQHAVRARFAVVLVLLPFALVYLRWLRVPGLHTLPRTVTHTPACPVHPIRLFTPHLPHCVWFCRGYVYVYIYTHYVLYICVPGYTFTVGLRSLRLPHAVAVAVFVLPHVCTLVYILPLRYYIPHSSGSFWFCVVCSVLAVAAFTRSFPVTCTRTRFGCTVIPPPRIYTRFCARFAGSAAVRTHLAGSVTARILPILRFYRCLRLLYVAGCAGCRAAVRGLRAARFVAAAPLHLPAAAVPLLRLYRLLLPVGSTALVTHFAVLRIYHRARSSPYGLVPRLRLQVVPVVVGYVLPGYRFVPVTFAVTTFRYTLHITLRLVLTLPVLPVRGSAFATPHTRVYTGFARGLVCAVYRTLRTPRLPRLRFTCTFTAVHVAFVTGSYHTVLRLPLLYRSRFCYGYTRYSSHRTRLRFVPGWFWFRCIWLGSTVTGSSRLQFVLPQFCRLRFGYVGLPVRGWLLVTVTLRGSRLRLRLRTYVWLHVTRYTLFTGYAFTVTGYARLLHGYVWCAFTRGCSLLRLHTPGCAGSHHSCYVLRLHVPGSRLRLYLPTYITLVLVTHTVTPHGYSWIHSLDYVYRTFPFYG